MKNKLILVVIILIVVGLHLLPLIPPDVEVPKSDDVKNASIEQANELYKNAMYGDAIRYYYELAQQGDAFAQYRVGFMYLHGEGINSDICESTRWFDKSARSGNSFAQFEMSNAYYEGYGIKRDPIKAYFWVREAIQTVDVERAKKEAVDIFKKQYNLIQENLSNSNKLNEASSLFESWQFQKEEPVEIVRLREIPVFDQFFKEFYSTLPCDYYKN
jgi:hypothetical protein